MPTPRRPSLIFTHTARAKSVILLLAIGGLVGVFTLVEGDVSRRELGAIGLAIVVGALLDMLRAIDPAEAADEWRRREWAYGYGRRPGRVKRLNDAVNSYGALIGAAGVVLAALALLK